MDELPLGKEIKNKCFRCILSGMKLKLLAFEKRNFKDAAAAAQLPGVNLL